jgi:hypothetical protein
MTKKEIIIQLICSKVKKYHSNTTTPYYANEVDPDKLAIFLEKHLDIKPEDLIDKQ